MKWVLLVILIFISCKIDAQLPFYKELVVGENDQQISVQALAQDNNGYVLLGTIAGVFMYNGREFTRLPCRRFPVTALAHTGNKTYIGYKDGVVTFLKNGKEQLFARAQVSINSITVVNDSTILACTDEEGILEYTCGKLTGRINTVNNLADNYVYEMASINRSLAYVAATDNGISILDSFIVQRSLSPTLTDDIVRAICYDQQRNQIIVGTQQGGICCIALNGNQTNSSYCTKNWQWGQVNDIIPVNPETYWVSTASGHLLSVIPMDTGFSVSMIYSSTKSLGEMLADKGGNIWCATSTGIILFSTAGIANFLLSSPYALKQITAVTCSANRRIYALGNKLYAANDTNGQQLLLTTRTIITTLHTDNKNRIWIGTLGDGILCYTGKLLPLNISALKNTHVISISSVGDTLWIAGLNGLEKVVLTSEGAVGNLIMQYDKRSGIGSDYIYQIFADSKKRIWLATDGAGLRMYDHNRFREMPIPGLTSKVIYSITESDDGSIWIAALRDGLFRFYNGYWQHFTDRNGLSDMNISALAAVNNTVVIVHQKGIDAYYPAQKIFRHYTRRLGMDIDSTSAVLNCYGKDQMGNVYIPYEHGFIRFGGHKPVNLRPDVHITSLSLFLEPLKQARNKFEASENYLTFNFRGINFTNPDRLYYRYNLTGFNKGWVVTNDETATFPQLPPGSYTFNVQTSLSANFDDPSDAQYSFTIARPLWQKPWFIICGIAIGAAVIMLYFRYRVKKLQQIARLEKERHAYEYEYLKGQVNPHFLFNSLNTIASLIDEDAKLATNYTLHLSDFYRNILAYNNKDLITISEEWELLEKYIYIQKTRFGNALDIKLCASNNIMRSIHIIPMGLQLLVENAIKHNVVSQAYPLQVLITVTENEITVQNYIRPKTNKEKGTGIGLENLKKRYALYNKTIELSKDQNIFFIKLPAL